MAEVEHPQIDSGYAWVRLTASLLLTTMGSAGMYVCMVGVPAYQFAFQVDRSDASLPYTWAMLGFGVGGMVIGRLVDRYGIVRPVFVSTLVLTLAFLAAARVQSYPVFALLHGVIGACGCAAVFSPLLADISCWFLRRRGFAIAVCASGNYVAGTIWPPLIDFLINDFGWRSAYTAFAWISAGVMLPLLLVLTRPSPTLAAAQSGGSAGSPQTLGVTSLQLTLLLCLAGVGCCTAMAMPQVHVVALTVDLGFSASHGAEMLSLMFGFGVISRLAFGWLSDRIGGLATLWLGAALQCASLMFFLPAEGLQALSVASALFGLFQGGIAPCYALIVREFYPEAEAAGRTGVVVFATLVGMAFGGWASGVIHDWTGSYDLAFLHSIGWNLVNHAVIGMLWMRARGGQARGGSPAPG